MPISLEQAKGFALSLLDGAVSGENTFASYSPGALCALRAVIGIDHTPSAYAIYQYGKYPTTDHVHSTFAKQIVVQQWYLGLFLLEVGTVLLNSIPPNVLEVSLQEPKSKE